MLEYIITGFLKCQVIFSDFLKYFLVVDFGYFLLEPHPHPFGMRLGFVGESRFRSIKKAVIPKGITAFLVRRKGLEPLTY